MFTTQLVLLLANAFLCAPEPDVNEQYQTSPAVSSSWWNRQWSEQVVLWPVRNHYRQQELLDERETWFFSTWSNFHSDLQTMEKRRQELESAPPSIEHLLFPDRDFIYEQLQFNRRCQDNLRNRMWPVWARATVQEYLVELKAIERTYEKALEITSKYYFVCSRRKALQELRDELLGPEMYYSGVLPPPVLLEYAQPID